MNRRSIILTGVFSLLVLTFFAAPQGRNLLYFALAETYQGEKLSVQQAHWAASKGEIILIDIRRPDEWKTTGIAASALPLDMRRDDFTQQLGMLVDGNKNAAVALICARGVRSAGLANRLQEAGFTRIMDVPEGMFGSAAGPGWLQSGLPLKSAG
ncbi:MAG: rhodanese-like domain-containing protein [Ahrensia sp.]|nr:rhodanese-like domain-containing protein [Ahrensia sp.]